MAQDMPGGPGRSWRSLAVARLAPKLAPIRDYLQRDRPVRGDSLPIENGYAADGSTKRPSWSQRWTGRSNSDSEDVATAERVVLLPGWVSRRYHKLPYRAGTYHFCLLFDSIAHIPKGTPYDIEIFVSGYVVKDRATDALSRSQRTLLKLAKSWSPSLFP